MTPAVSPAFVALSDAILNNPMSVDDIARSLRVDPRAILAALRGEGPEPEANLIARARQLAIWALRVWHYDF